jgi:hypothetical protein
MEVSLNPRASLSYFVRRIGMFFLVVFVAASFDLFISSAARPAIGGARADGIQAGVDIAGPHGDDPHHGLV